jgi:hypothetical protein
MEVVSFRRGFLQVDEVVISRGTAARAVDAKVDFPCTGCRHLVMKASL